MRGPACFDFGTLCSQPIWQRPPMTRRSPEPGRKSRDRRGPSADLGRIKNGRRAPNVRIAIRVSSSSRSSRSLCHATLSEPSR